MSSESKENNTDETRQARRAKKLRKEKERIKKHGRSLGQMYKDAVEKRKRG